MGTSRTNTCEIRRAVRRPVAEGTTAAISSSVWRLPFISASTWPARVISTAFMAAAWLCSTETIWNGEMSIPSARATARIFASGPISTGTIRFARAASIAPPSEALSQGCTIAQVTGGSWSQRFISLPKPSLRRRMICGVARSLYAMRLVGAEIVIMPSISASPRWLRQVTSNSIRCPCLCLTLAATVAVSVSPM